MAFVELAKHKHRPLQSTVPRLEQFWLYEARSNFYVVGFDAAQTFFKMLKISRENPNPREISEIVREDPLIYNAEEIRDILDMISEGNKTQGGLVKLCTACGIVGFVKFLNGFYLTMITQKKEVGCIGGNYIYTIKATEMFPIRPKDETTGNTLRYLWKQINKRLSQTSSEMAENRYLGLFQFIDMTKDFFFSYSYDLTHSMQHNYLTTSDGRVTKPQDIFEWNHYQIHGLRSVLGEGSSLMWTIPIIHGSFQQKRFTFFGKNMDLILMARRSRYYAGTRYLKRGINVHGKVANDVEVEQIIQFDNGADFKFTSYVQMRGSIPTFWAQETSLTMPKPPITLSRTDPDYLATQEHFADLMRRYSSPIIVLDLVKQHEKRPRESLVGREFRQAIEIINETIPSPYQVRYIALDYSKITSISKGKLSKAKPTKRGFMGLRTPAEKERAMAAVGQEWAMMEKSLTKNDPASTDPATNEVTATSKIGNASLSHSKRTTATNHGRSASPPPASPAVASGFASLDEARKAIDAEHVSSTYHYSSASSPAPYAHALPGGLENIAEINALESRIDVLKELEDIATLTLSETAFFCNTTQFADRLVNVVPRQTMDLAMRTGVFLQSGVLRTNCIDCLDRTNGGQFAVAMRFLAFAFRALGVSEDHSLDISKDPVLLSLMEMYGEMGDKIALQYGGSEAHKKVIAGKSVQSTSSSKQSELLTSIKRYYSNAFTDMMKQDAMNLFLGCFNPLDSSLPLWDMESDQSLHNLSLHPPFPKAYSVMFDGIIRDSEILRHSSLRSKLEQRLKKVIMYGLDVDTSFSSGLKRVSSKRAIASSGSFSNLSNSAGSMMASTGEIMKDSDSTIDVNNTTENSANDNNALLVKRAFEFITQQYFIRPLASCGTSDASLRNAIGSQRQSSRGLVSSITRQLARLERRRLMRLTAYRKVTKASQDWWQSALRGHVHSLLVDDCKDAKVQFQNIPGLTVKSLSYYERFHQPHQLSEFDFLLTQEFSTPIIGAEAAAVESTTLDNMTGRLRSIAHHEDDEANIFDELADVIDGEGKKQQNRRRLESADDAQHQPAINSLMSFFFSPPSPTNIPKEDESVTKNRHDSLSRSRHNYVDQLDDGPVQKQVNFAGNASSNTGYGLTKYVREFGQKAKNIISGGFMRRDGEDSPRSEHGHQGRDMTGLLRAAHDFNRRNAPITSLLHYIPQMSAVMYNQYAEVFHNPLLLLNPDPDEHQDLMREISLELMRIQHEKTVSFTTKTQQQSRKSDSTKKKTETNSSINGQIPNKKNKKTVSIKKVNKLAAAEKLLEDEYKFLLRDSIIPLDDVRRMEQLASDGYISSDIQKGLFAGMSQMSSANLAVSLLFISLVNMEKELQQFGEHVEQQAERSRARSLALDSNSKTMTTNSNGNQITNSHGLNHGFADDDDDILVDSNDLAKQSKSNNNKKATLVRSAFATTALPFLGLGGGFGGMSSSNAGNNNIGNNNAGNNNSRKSAKTSSLEMTTALNDRIAECLQRMRVANGLEAEFRKYVNNYIFQQYNYLKEISLERLSRRISTLTSEKSIIHYSTQFEHDLVASCWRNVMYMAIESPNYASFRELRLFDANEMNPRQEALARTCNEYSRKIGQDKLIQTTDSNSRHCNTDGSFLKKESLEQTTQHREKKKQKKKRYGEVAFAELLFSKPEKQKDSQSVNTGELTVVNSESQFQKGSPLSSDILWRDLESDFSLPGLVTSETIDEYKTFPFYFSESSHVGCNSSGVSHAYLAAFEDFSDVATNHFVQPDIFGFNQLAPDLYSRRTNPHLQMNEICSSRFKDVLLASESG